VWATFVQLATNLGTGAKVNLDLLGNLKVAGSSVLGCTVMRTHAKLAISEASADTGQGFNVGFIVDDAVNVTNVDPSTAFGNDWMLLTTVSPATTKYGKTYISGTNLVWGDEIDLRSKRKIEEIGEDYLLCLENAGSGTASYSTFVRTLLALP